jgi:HlyD family secretion protein
MKRLLLLMIAAVLAGAVGLAAYYRSSDDSDPALTTAVVTRGPVVERVQATGTLQAVTTVQVGTQVSGTISALYADFNSKVRKGQVLARLEPSLFQAQVDQASATVQHLQADADRAAVEVEDAHVKLRRAEQLSGQQLIPASDLDAARTAARQAEAALKSAQAQIVQARAALNQNNVNLGHTTITAPVNGVVVSRNVDVGQTVAATMQAPTLFVLAEDLAHMQVNASIDESDIGRIEEGLPVSFQVDAYPNETFHGTVRQVRLDPVIDQGVVSYITVIDVANPDLKLRPGMTATVSVEVARTDDGLRVPNAAFRYQPDSGGAQTTTPSDANARSARIPGRGAAVWILAEDGLRHVPVKTAVNDGTTTAVVGGDLREGARVVTGVVADTAASASNSSPLLPRFGRNRQSTSQQRQGGAR